MVVATQVLRDQRGLEKWVNAKLLDVLYEGLDAKSGGASAARGGGAVEMTQTGATAQQRCVRRSSAHPFRLPTSVPGSLHPSAQPSRRFAPAARHVSRYPHAKL